ncbi:hypothetical protein N0V90_011522 [Kalmusia sp. IMI 367209]|nr:hypothetical protein N0V90_011522 [Kalmusia sp. IMI 367209]
MTSTSIPTYFQTMSPTPSATPPAPQSSALPPFTDSSNIAHNRNEPTPDTAANEKVKPSRKPLLRLELRDLSSEGTRAFLRLLHASTTLEDAVDAVLRLLYTDLGSHCIPPTRSITLVLRSMPGVAYTTGRDIDDDHKEIHFSTDYINHIPEARKKEEMQGVIVHEMVHCWQHNALGTAPGGLIEGIADWVRLKAGFAPPHWKRTADSDWDAGYERTGFFLEWLEAAHGGDVVRKINEGLRGCKYESDTFWKRCCGKSINHLWKEYKSSLGEDTGNDLGKLDAGETKDTSDAGKDNAAHP